MVSTKGAKTTKDEPGFCCNNGVGSCIGGFTPDIPCVVDSDCLSAPGSPATCSERVADPGGKGLGTLWLKFVQPVGITTAGISTCGSNSPALDSIVQVFAATDHSSPRAECNSLVPLACNDDSAYCSSTQRNSRLCLRDLTPGETYYIMLAAKTPNRMGSYIVTLSTNCSGSTAACPNCPSGEIVFINPPDGVVDARRPHAFNSPASLEGINVFEVLAPDGAARECWSFCESAEESSVAIEWLSNEFGFHQVGLNKPLTPGSTAFLTYRDNNGHATRGRFMVHPGNANADSRSNAADILSLIDHINGISPLPWGPYAGDLDHSGIVGPADIITLIDLLNGNGFGAWYGTQLPQAGCP